MELRNRNRKNTFPFLILIHTEKEKKYYISIFDKLICVSWNIIFLSPFSQSRLKILYIFNINFFSCFPIKVPKKYDFIHVLDLFYKVHKVFYIPFHAHLQQVMGFFGSYIYDIKDDERFTTAKTMSYRHILNQNPQYIYDQWIQLVAICESSQNVQSSRSHRCKQKSVYSD